MTRLSTASVKYFLSNIRPSEVQARLVELRSRNINESLEYRDSFFKIVRFRRPKKELTIFEIEAFRNILVQCCLKSAQDVYTVHLNRVKGLELLNTLIDSSPIEKINEEIATHMVWAGASCIHHFLLKVTLQNTLIQKIRRKELKRALLVFEKLVRFLTADGYWTVFNAVVTFLEEGNVWDVEHYCSYLLTTVLSSTIEFEIINSIMHIISLVENVYLVDSIQPRKILQVLEQIEETHQWAWLNEELIEKFLDMYRNSLTLEDNYKCLEKNMESILRAMSKYFDPKRLMFMIQWMLQVVTGDELSNKSLLYFTELLEEFVVQYRQKSENAPLPETIVPIIFEYMGSENHMRSLLGHRLLHGFFDRCNNKPEFQTPKIYMSNSHYDIVLNSYKVQDKETFQKHAELYHKTIVQCVLRHGNDKVFLDNVYTTIALFLVEIPCLYTTAAGLYVAISLQEAALHASNMTLEHAHHIHAIAGSILSLMCHIHQASVLYEYVEKIIERRAKWAPHLNPPLKLKYDYGQHEILWNKKDLFFEDWESKYGLWRCFKNNQFKSVVVQI